MVKKIRSTLCQCTKCGAVFPYSERSLSVESPLGRCNQKDCLGAITIIRFENEQDESYIWDLGNRFSE